MALRDQTHPTPTQRTAFQWQVLLEDNDWQRPVELDDLRRAAATGPPSPQPRPWSPWQRWTTALALLFLVGIAATLLRQQALQNLAALAQEVQESVTVEAVMRPALPPLVLPLELDADLACEETQTTTEILAYDPERGLALVDLTVSNPCFDLTFQMARVYRRLPTGWTQTAPVPDLWGRRLQWESEYFIFDYPSREMAAVTAAAPRLDALYRRLVTRFGPIAEPDPPTDKLRIFLNVATEPTVEVRSGFLDGVQRVAVPSLFPRTPEVEPATVLVQAVAAPLVNHVYQQWQTSIPEAWRVLIRDGLLLWQLWEQELPTAYLRPTLVEWLYVDSAPMPPPGVDQRHNALCSFYQLWRLNPLNLGIPFVCRSPGGLEPMRLWPVDSVAELSPMVWQLNRDPYIIDTIHVSVPAISVATLFDYTATAYGRDALPRLLAGMHTHDSWQSLIPATFGVTVAQFEQDWRAHVQTLTQPAAR